MDEMGQYHCPRCGYDFRGRFADNDTFVCKNCKGRFVAALNEKTGELAFRPEQAKELPEPLFLPRGSIRSAVALILALCSWLLMMAGRNVPSSLLSLLLTVVAYYFGFRSGSADATIFDPSRRPRDPLFLPEGIVRRVLIGGFALALASLALNRRLSFAYVEFFMILFGLLLGYGFARLMDRVKSGGISTLVTHAKGLLVLGAAAVLAYLYLTGRQADVWVGHMSLLCAVPTFYYGSRS